MAHAEHVVEKEMGFSHAEFRRLLPKAMDGAEIIDEGETFRIGDGNRLLRIDLSEESERRLGHIRIPVTHVRLTFRGYSEAEIEAALFRFERSFHKGGG